ncbi:C1 family peptidase [Limobrevibacterium gyesilva]|uniref:C1 family peptidase n=1 Tax=Limobrevibacterium gyesilva TaxID=2991712 RepID=A0AA41YRF7_9PROT|nr:C1 family peptidase [Limobrevibacterium gyesilva]MCW3474147.1 C1 family peptidase [Limobrevibacterium gyesilva]
MPDQNALKPHSIQKYGWIPDLPDMRDHMYSAPMPTLATLPTSVDLRQQCPPVYDQGQLGSCTGNAIAGAIHFDRLKANQTPDFVPSRLFIYYNERVIEHTVSTDSGAMIRDGIKSVNKLGVCPETPDWPYDITKFAKKPPASAYTDAKRHQVVSYSRLLNTVQQMRGCLAAGYPFVFGFSVYASFESQQVAQTGVVPMPQPSEQQIGGHAVLAVGYDDTQQRFIVRNSWGTGWGMQGYFTMPYAYLTDNNLADDFWTVRMIEA